MLMEQLLEPDFEFQWLKYNLSYLFRYSWSKSKNKSIYNFNYKWKHFMKISRWLYRKFLKLGGTRYLQILWAFRVGRRERLYACRYASQISYSTSWTCFYFGIFYHKSSNAYLFPIKKETSENVFAKILHTLTSTRWFTVMLKNIPYFSQFYFIKQFKCH